MSTKQIEKIRVSKEQLEQDINDSWKEFLESGDSNIENPKNTFTKYIKEAFETFLKLGEGSKNAISIGKNTGLYYDFALNSIIYINKKTKADMENADKFSKNFASVFINWLQRLIITQVSKVQLSDEKTKSIIDAVRRSLPKSKDKQYFQYLYTDDPGYYYFSDLDSGKIEKTWYPYIERDAGNEIWIFALLYMNQDYFRQIFYKFIRSNLPMNDLDDSMAYKVLQGFKFEEGKFIISNLDILKNLELEIDGSVAAGPFLYEDKIRADIKEYEPKMLTDVGLGLWELWEIDESKNDGVEVKLERSLTARDPKSSIKDGVVGIDFGTKSTVVVYQEDTVKINPMRVGIGDLGKKIEKSHYENPTIISFGDLGKFIQDYEAREGRPYTRWEDVNISHAAYNSLLQSASSEYNSYLNELKQWAGQRDKKLKIFDRKGKEFEIKGFSELEDGDINPIEIYAYYLGLYINNQRNGIFLDYILSFPVTYEMDIREKILKSFYKGIKKSLPLSLQTPEILSKLKVISGASEPAAYAVIALEENKFEPVGDEKVFYGVFDFGGGTTDFDFGVYREADKDSRYDYVIEHFGAGGDKYLGGENLLELVAFELFKANKEKLLESKIQFTLPPECEKFAGHETLISSAQEARRNTKELMEKLRPLWEGKDDGELYKDGILSVNLIDTKGKQIAGFSLDIDKSKILEILEARIKRGVDNFFEALRLAFSNKKVDLGTIKEVNIFLAGNSSKSAFVEKLFNEKIAQEEENLSKEFQKPLEGLYRIYRPLGENDSDFERPNGKTGVAFGLIRSKKGGTILVKDHNVGSDINFKYYLGKKKKGKFNTVVSRDAKYGDWIKFMDASESVFEVFYTTQASVTTNSVDISDSGIKKMRIDTGFADENCYIYIRIVSPSKFEYVVADEEGIKNGNYKTEIQGKDI
ncbi:molecular chaperone DnaK [uncultured Campylobacter sp.]|uniref:molecular chaperone DnaK n=1 Tax=uncultured Campylobacter sp. TaxID=218934 RepID=UPI0032119595